MLETFELFHWKIIENRPNFSLILNFWTIREFCKNKFFPCILLKITNIDSWYVKLNTKLFTLNLYLYFDYANYIIPLMEELFNFLCVAAIFVNITGSHEAKSNKKINCFSFITFFCFCLVFFGCSLSVKLLKAQY